jgi:HSP20 family molecular chaperone IbpA
MALFDQLIPSRNRRQESENNTETERFVAPVYELKEAGDAYGLEVFVPGVSKDAVEINVDQGELVVTARRRWKAPQEWNEIFRESSESDYRLRIDLNEAVDVDKIAAELEAGVLRVTLPKAESFKPRKIDVN